MKIKLDPSQLNKIRVRLEKWDLRVGILDDKPHKLADDGGLFDQKNLSSYAGGDIRKTSRQNSAFSIAEVLKMNMQRLGINILLAPFEDPSSEILRFANNFLKMATSKGTNTKRVENLLQAIVRNPILKQAYGPNKKITADVKGFNRHLIDTAQMFKNIKARVRRG